MAKPRWRDLSEKRRLAFAAAGVVQLGLAVFAWTDLARRSAAAVNGRKSWWAVVIGVNFVGPLAYLRYGRRPSSRAR